MNSRIRSPTIANLSTIETLTSPENEVNVFELINCCPTVALLRAYIMIIGSI